MLLYDFAGRTGLFCPCVLYGRNIEAVRDEIPWTQPCVCHAICVEGGMALAAVTALFSGYIDPQTTVVICEGLFFAWWMCGIYSGLFRQELQKKYHLRVSKNPTSHHFYISDMISDWFLWFSCRMRRVIIAWFTVACTGVLYARNTGRWRIIFLIQKPHHQLLWILPQFKRWTPRRKETLHLLHLLRLHPHHLLKANTMILRWSLYRKHSLLNSAAYALSCFFCAEKFSYQMILLPLGFKYGSLV